MAEVQKNCDCDWDGNDVKYCADCDTLMEEGHLLLVGKARGWQVRRFYNPLKSLRAQLREERLETPRDPPTLQQCNQGLNATPSAPPLYPDVGKLHQENEVGQQGDMWNPGGLLEQAVKQAWPYNPLIGQAGSVPLQTNLFPLVLRVFRSPLGEEIEEVSQKSDEAQRGGRTGPWELVMWAQLIAEVILDPDIPLTDLPEVPREAEARKTSLYYYTTSIDAWTVQGASPKQKTTKFLVTPDAWERNGVLQIPRTAAQ